jgi:CubicO group peptidase (beta-lactamase class C family)
MKKSRLLTLVVLVCFAASCNKETLEPTQELKTNNPLSTDFDKRINEILAPFAKQISTAGVSVGVFKDNQTFYYGYGETKKGNNAIPNSETIYEIGSITKTFTALLMMDYLQSNSLSINNPINNFLPYDVPLLARSNVPIRVRHLLNHTSGLPRLPEDFEAGMDINNPYKHYDSTKVYNFLKNYRLMVEPGEVWEYSNLGMGLVGLILERKTHMSYEDLLKVKICTPLGLSKTKITLNSNDSLNYAVGYDAYGTQVPYWDDMNAFKGAGAIRSNAKDMIAYGKNILNYETSLLKTPIDSCLKVTYDNGSTKMASGWIYQTINGNDIVIHDGGTAGFNSYIVICKSKNVVLVILFSNGPSSFRANLINQLILEVIK